MFEKLRICLFDMAMCFSEALDLVSPRVVDHHKRVAYLASRIATAAGLDPEQCATILLAGLLHDLGAVTHQDRIEALNFDFDHPHLHAERGYKLIRTNELFAEAAEVIRSHHVPWEKGRGASFRGRPVPLGSHVVHLADRIAVLVRKDREILGQVPGITERILRGAGKKFMPRLVEAFRDLAQSEYFWFDVTSPKLGVILLRQPHSSVELHSRQLLGVTKLFSHIIDCRSRFTANHSTGVAAVGERLAGLAGLSREERTMVEIAGHLHDLGKLSVPTSILEKAGRLTPREFNIVRKHPYDTFRILEPIESLLTITKWASLHHEHVNGEGYPFRYSGDNIPLGARIMAVADTFTALSEPRPYRPGMKQALVASTLQDMSRGGLLDDGIANLAVKHQATLEFVRRGAQDDRSVAPGV